jgi:arylsulfatase A-like enzyme
MTRRTFRSTLGCLVALALILSTAAPRAQTRPNIVVFMIDDFDADSLNMLIQHGMMPNLKKYFLDAGSEFTESFSVASLGGPSRATFLTGQYPHNHGVRTNYPPLGGVTALNASSTLATWLRTAGYRNALVGRYVTGYGLLTDPRMIPPGWHDWQVLVETTFAFNTAQYTMNLNGTLVDFGQLAGQWGVDLYQTDMLTTLGLIAIQRAVADPRPFFLQIASTSFNFEFPFYNECADAADTGPFGGSFLGVTQRPAARHLNTIFGNSADFPLPGGEAFNEEDVSDKPEWLQANPPFNAQDIDCLQKRQWRKLETMRAVDDQVGAIMGDLERRGLLNRTVAIFAGDNGFMDGQHRFPQKTPAYEESIRVPLVIRMPGLPAPRKIDKLVLTTDMAPTIAHLALATPTHPVDGRSLVPLLNNPQTTSWRTVGLLTHAAEGPPQFERITLPPDYAGLRTAGPTPRKYVKYPTVTSGVAGELYDLTTDPRELTNLFADPQRQTEVQRLDLFLNAMKTCRGLTCTLIENLFTLQ